MEGAQNHWQFQTLPHQMGLSDHTAVHLPQNNSGTLASHVTGTDAVFHTVGCETVLFQDTDTASGERNRKGPVAETIQLAAEGETTVAEETDGVDGLAEAEGVVEVLG